MTLTNTTNNNGRKLQLDHGVAVHGTRKRAVPGWAQPAGARPQTPWTAGVPVS